MDEAQKVAKYDALLKEAVKAYLSRQYEDALIIYNDALNLTNDLKVKKKKVFTIKCMICCCLVESNELDSLSEAVKILETIDRYTKEKFPTIYCLLAKAHCKLYRFDEALYYINEGEAILSKNPLFDPLYIPGTNIEILQNQIDDIMTNIKKKYLMSPIPNGICKLSQCRYITKPYITPNINIYMNDPAFTGMVVVNCNNKKQPCTFNYHKYCWTFKKNEMYPIQKDNDIIGSPCFTLNCINDNVPCTISSIEVIEKFKEKQTEMKKLSSTDSSNMALSQGAIKKQIYIENYDKRQINNKKYETEINHKHYDERQILVIKEKLLDDDFSNKSSDLANKKNFLLSFFYHYIQNNFVQVCDAYSKFEEINRDLKLVDIDIVTFLLESKKIAILDNISMPPFSHVQKTTINNNNNFHKEICNNDSIEDIDDVYNELINNEDKICRKIESFEDNVNSIHNYQNDILVENVQGDYNFNCENNACSIYLDNEVTKSVALLPLEISVNKKPSKMNKHFEKKKLLEMTRNSMNIFNKIVQENTRLEESINGLKNKIIEMEKQNRTLNQKVREKDSIIESLKQEKVDYLKKIEVYESLSETMTDFEKTYENIKNDNLKMKREIIYLVEDKNNLEKKLCKKNSPNFRKEILKIFQEEYKILEDCINNDWGEKMNKLQTALEAEIVMKINLLNECLGHQFFANRFILNRYLDQCTVIIKIIDSVNSWMESIINMKLFKDCDWKNRLNFIKKIIDDQQLQYSKSLELLNSNSKEKYKLANIKLNLPAIPNPSGPDIQEVVQNTLITLSVIHTNFMRHIYQSGTCFNKETFVQDIHQMLKIVLLNTQNLPFNSISHKSKYNQLLSETNVISSTITSEESVQQTHQLLRSQDSGWSTCLE